MKNKMLKILCYLIVLGLVIIAIIDQKVNIKGECIINDIEIINDSFSLNYLKCNYDINMPLISLFLIGGD